MIIPEEGMPNHSYPSESGDLYVEFNIIMPESITESQKQGIKRIVGFPFTALELKNIFA